MMQRSWPRARTSAGGSSVMSANDSRSGLFLSRPLASGKHGFASTRAELDHHLPRLLAANSSSCGAAPSRAGTSRSGSSTPSSRISTPTANVRMVEPDRPRASCAIATNCAIRNTPNQGSFGRLIALSRMRFIGSIRHPFERWVSWASAVVVGRLDVTMLGIGRARTCEAIKSGWIDSREEFDGGPWKPEHHCAALARKAFSPSCVRSDQAGLSSGTGLACGKARHKRWPRP